MEFVAAANRFRVAPTCPCGKSNKDQKFSPLKNDADAGFCHSCGQTFFSSEEKCVIKQIITAHSHRLPNFHEKFLMESTLISAAKNNFVNFCQMLFPHRNVEELAIKYGVGTFEHHGAQSTVFWQRDQLKRVRGGKVINYCKLTGKRIKEPAERWPVSWVHTILKLPNFKLSQCLFGLHLLTDNEKVVAVVESEKTAFIMALVDDSRLWVATGGKHNFKYDILKDLKGYKIEAYPDNGEFHLWERVAKSLIKYGIRIRVSSKLEKATHPKGYDLADKVIKRTLSERPAIRQDNLHTDSHAASALRLDRM